MRTDRRLATAVLLLAVAGAACSGSPTAPSPPPAPPPPQPTPNAPPVIRAVTVPVSRVEVDQDVPVTADVTDAETNPDLLTYEWSATAGTFSGAGRSVTWRLGTGAATTPLDITITLTVIERWVEPDGAGGTRAREQRVSGDAAPFRAHDSVAELSAMTLTFLVDYFGNSAVSPNDCLVDFADSCQGKADERIDIENNRRDFIILSAQARIGSVAINGARTFAEVTAPCTFRSIIRATGATGTVTGDCYLTAIYEQRRWWLCSSQFLNGVILESMRGFFGIDRAGS